jgi:hypothetical protein
VDDEPSTQPWWRDARQRTRVAVGVFAALALIGILFPAFANRLFAGDRRVMVVTMEADAGLENRERLKRACGDLPGISVVADRGDPSLQGSFPVRFNIADTTLRQEAALQACINEHAELGVLGFLVENDGN